MTTARLVGVTRTFGPLTALADLDLELQAGTIYGILGPNGAGKTTTIRTLLGLSLPDRGLVEIFGGPPDDRKRARVGLVPESRALAADAQVGDLLVLFARMRGHDRPTALRVARSWIERMELGVKETEIISTLSNGQQQKVQVALALIHEPDLLLLDEPLTGLDPRHQELVFRQVREAAQRGATVLMSTHRLREAQTLVHHIFMLAQGRKVLDRPLKQALEDAFDGTWQVRTPTPAPWVQGPEVIDVTPNGDTLLVRLAPGATIHPMLQRAAEAEADLRGVVRLLPDLHELYIRHVGADSLPDVPPAATP